MREQASGRSESSRSAGAGTARRIRREAGCLLDLARPGDAGVGRADSTRKLLQIGSPVTRHEREDRAPVADHEDRLDDLLQRTAGRPRGVLGGRGPRPKLFESCLRACRPQKGGDPLDRFGPGHLHGASVPVRRVTEPERRAARTRARPPHGLTLRYGFAVLYAAEAFEPLTETPWDTGRVSGLVRAIVADTDGAFAEDTLWPAHEWDSWQTPLPLQNLYCGAAGVIWALATLRDRGHATSRLDLVEAARRTLEAWRRQPSLIGLELPEPAEASLLDGETGILAVLLRLEPAAELADRLLELVRANVGNPADEVMWGVPGTMLAARAMLDQTGEERWADAWRESAVALLGRRDSDGLWTQYLHSESSRGLGPPHGVIGNVLSLLQGGELLAAEERRMLEDETAALLRRTAIVEDGLANWPVADGRDLVGSDGQVGCSGTSARPESSHPLPRIWTRISCSRRRS